MRKDNIDVSLTLVTNEYLKILPNLPNANPIVTVQNPIINMAVE